MVFACIPSITGSQTYPTLTIRYRDRIIEMSPSGRSNQATASRKNGRQLLKLNPPKPINNAQPALPPLDTTYVENQKQCIEKLWSLIKMADNIHQQLIDKPNHYSLFCDEDADGYRTTQKNDKLLCYCRDIAKHFQHYGPRAGFGDRLAAPEAVSSYFAVLCIF